MDAEKYSLYVEGYDRLLCWAGTASNMLWMAGYAQNAINPLTGETFKSEDEVFDYYRTYFTDDAGDELAGIVYFINVPKNNIYLAPMAIDESCSYDELNIKCFSLCIPTCGNMHSDIGIYARKESFYHYVEILKNLCIELCNKK